MPASIPSPDQSVWYLGPLPIRAYAICILLGIVVAIVVTRSALGASRRDAQGLTYDVAMWAVPFGIVGGRLYHVATDWQTYFGPDGAGLVAALQDLERRAGHLGRRRARRRRVPGSGVGGRACRCLRSATRWPSACRWRRRSGASATGSTRSSSVGPRTCPGASRSIRSTGPRATSSTRRSTRPSCTRRSGWSLVAGAVAWADRRWRLGHGRAFALYVALYCVGRFGIELLRIDPATHVEGLRINVITAVVVGIGALAYLRDQRPAAARPRDAGSAAAGRRASPSSRSPARAH